MRSRTVAAVMASAVVIAVVVSIILLSAIPLPNFPPLRAGLYPTWIAFVDEDNCVQVADVGHATVRELRCEPEQGWIDDIQWDQAGIQITAYLNQPTTRVIDPDNGEIVETRTGDQVIGTLPAVRASLVVDRPESDRIVVYDEQGAELLALHGPERYWVEAAIASPDGDLVAIVDTQGRLAVFRRAEGEPYLVSGNVRAWPNPVWGE